MTATEKETVTPQQRLTILKHLINGKSPDVVATIVGLSRERVFTLGRGHGFPDVDTMKRAAELVEKKIDDDATAAIPSRTERPARSIITGPNEQGGKLEVTPLTKPDEIRVLLNTAKQHPAKRIQNQADKVFDALDRLRAMIREDDEKNAEKRKAEADKAAARAEVERLEQALAEARAKLRGKSYSHKDLNSEVAKVKTTAPKGEHPCRNDGCDKVYDTPQGRSLHERMKCEHRAEAAAS